MRGCWSCSSLWLLAWRWMQGLWGEAFRHVFYWVAFVGLSAVSTCMWTSCDGWVRSMTSEFRRHRACSYVWERACELTMLNSLIASWIPNKDVSREFFSYEDRDPHAWKPRANRNERTLITSRIVRSDWSLSLATLGALSMIIINSFWFLKKITLYRSFCSIGMVEYGSVTLTDRRTDGRTDGRTW